MIHFFYGLEQLIPCTDEIRAIVTPYLSDRTTASMKRRSARINKFDSTELATSIWTARLTKHVNRAPYRFTSLRPSLWMKSSK